MYQKINERDLEDYAIRVGIPLNQIYDRHGVMSEPDLVVRIRESERRLRENRLSLLAFFATTVSLLTAIAAWITIMSR